MTWDLGNVRLVTASAYPGLMGSLVAHPSTVCVLSGDADTDALVPPTVAKQSLEVLAGVRRRWQAGDVAGLADFVPKVLAGTPADDRPLVIVAPRVTAAWRAAAATWPDDIRPLDRFDVDQSRIAEDKAYLRDQLRSLGVPVPTSITAPAPAISYAPVARALGTPFVMQAPNSAGGQGTYLITGRHDLLQTLAERADVPCWLISAYAGEVTINVSGIVYVDGYEILPASVQSSGIAEAGVGFGAYCGSDFGAVRHLPAAVLTEAYRHTARIAEWLREVGYRGLFGADIAVAGERLSFLEVNPRIQGSSWLLDLILHRERGRGCLPAHVDAMLGTAAPRPSSWCPSPVDGGCVLMVRWTGPTGIVRAVRPPWDGQDRITGLPVRGTVLSSRAILGRIASPTALVAPGGTSLLPDGARRVAELMASVDVTPLPSGVDHVETGRFSRRS